jgi:hypothetical protein
MVASAPFHHDSAMIRGMTTTSRSRRIRPAPAKSAASPLPMPRVLWDATTTPDVVTVPARSVLALDGEGAPEGETFQHSVGAMYGVAYTLKFARKKAGGRDFKIGPLEARWWAEPPGRLLPETPRTAWRWQLRMALPDDVTAGELARTIEAATHKKGGKLEGSAQAARLVLVKLPAARFGRALHIGPYSTEGQSFERIIAAIERAGAVAGTAHVEVYLGDPRRTKPEKLKTVLLLELGSQ